MQRKGPSAFLFWILNPSACVLLILLIITCIERFIFWQPILQEVVSMNKAFIFLLMFILTVLTACGTTNNDNQFGFQSETSDTLKDNEESGRKDVSYVEGEITDIADRNPNFLDLNTENEAHNNQGSYQQKLREIVESTGDFDAGMIYINGHKAIVNVTPKRNLSRDDLHWRTDDLERKLANAVPRYKIDLRVNNNNA